MKTLESRGSVEHLCWRDRVWSKACHVLTQPTNELAFVEVEVLEEPLVATEEQVWAAVQVGWSSEAAGIAEEGCGPKVGWAEHQTPHLHLLEYRGHPLWTEGSLIISNSDSQSLQTMHEPSVSQDACPNPYSVLCYLGPEFKSTKKCARAI